MTYQVSDIDRYIINYAYENEESITNLKLQKILYFLYGSYYAMTCEELFSDSFEAWAYGPVVRSSYINYSIFGAETIPPHNNYLNLLFDKEVGYNSELNEQFYIKLFNDKTMDLINDTLDVLIKLPAMKLVEISHKEGGPWSKFYERGNKKLIKKDYLLEYFASLNRGISYE